MRYSPEQKDLVLDLWADYNAPQICDLMAERGWDITPQSVWKIVGKARGRDPRAIRHHGRAVYG